MKLSELHTIFLAELRKLLPDWRFISTQRSFKRSVGSVNWLFHIGWVNHIEDFDAIGNVAVEFVAAKQRVAIFGAQLGNIAGIGQTRHSVRSVPTAKSSARTLVDEFHTIGVPFLERYSCPKTVQSVLLADGPEALLISPLREQHEREVLALQMLEIPPSNSIETKQECGSD
jgi:hypothetical protein